MPAASTPDSAEPVRLLRTLAPTIVLYTLSLAWLAHQGWQPHDVIWSLWATSLLAGYGTLLFGVLGQAWRSLRGVELDPDKLIVAVPGLLLAGLFFLGFFTVHFGMFHAIHGVFLNHFFPLVDWGRDEPGLPVQVFAYLAACFERYPLFIAICLLAQLPGWFGGLGLRAAFTAPYANVIKLHLTILAIGFSQALGMEAVALIVFLAVYFLPLRTLFAALRPPRPGAAE